MVEPPPPVAPALARSGRLPLRAAIACGAIVWLGAVTWGFASLFAHGNTPGQTPAAPSTWPATAPMPLADDRPTLVMFVHPHCPCTLASLAELDRVVARTGGRVAAHALYWADPVRGDEWAKAASWERAALIPHLHRHVDRDGDAARSFGAVTSGSVVVYAPDGRLLFHGGITGARGHEGDNAGADAIVALLNGAPSLPAAAPTPAAVFGCDLLTPATPR